MRIYSDTDLQAELLLPACCGSRLVPQSRFSFPSLLFETLRERDAPRTGRSANGTLCERLLHGLPVIYVLKLYPPLSPESQIGNLSDEWIRKRSSTGASDQAKRAFGGNLPPETSRNFVGEASPTKLAPENAFVTTFGLIAQISVDTYSQPCS